MLGSAWRPSATLPFPCLPFFGLCASGSQALQLRRQRTAPFVVAVAQAGFPPFHKPENTEIQFFSKSSSASVAVEP